MDADLNRLDWSLVQAFLAVADTGSLSAAARRLGTSQPTLGRQIARLEEALALSLFDRRPRGLELSRAGQALLPAARRMGEASGALALAAAGQDDGLHGTLRITASEVVAHHILPPLIARIRQAAPRLAVELVASDAPGNLLFREADIAVRMYRPDQLDIVARKLGEIEIAAFATPGYLERAGRPAAAEDLQHHDLIGMDRSELMLQQMRKLGWPATRETFALRCDNQVAYWELVRAGCGIGFFQAHLGRADPLVEELDLGLDLPSLPIWLAAHATVRRTPRVALAWRLLEDGLTPALRRP